MKYEKDKNRLTEILMTSNNINEYREELLKIIPELIITVDCTQDHPAHIYNVFDHTIKVVDGVKFNLVLKLSALLHDIGKPYVSQYVDGVERFWGHEEVSSVLAYHILNRLKYDNDVIEKVVRLIKYHDLKITSSEVGVLQSLNIVGNDLMPLFLEHKKSDLMAHAPKYTGIMIEHLNRINDIYEKLDL